MYLLDLIGTFAFAVTGAIKAELRGLHLFGAIFLGIITAIGGGTIRDVVIDRVPLFYLKDPNYLILAIVASILTYLIPAFFKKWYTFFRLIDSIGLASFAIIGVSISYQHLFLDCKLCILSLLGCVFLGMLTAFGGGVIRDAVLGEVPFSLRKGSNYAFSAFIGSLSFFLLMFVNLYLAIIFSMAITLYFREVRSRFGIYRKIIKKKN